MSSDDFRRKRYQIPIALEGLPFIVAAMFTTIVFAVLGWAVLTIPLLIITFLVWHFFRDPERVSNAGENEVVSPADGKVIAIKRVSSVFFTGQSALKISVFMSIFDVHVNRVPISGTIQGVQYRKGSFLAADTVQASDKNEQNWIWVQSDSGVNLVMTQVAGLIARRIVCWPRVGDKVTQAERFGMIRFGSRMDVYVPEESEILVTQGQHVYAGETILCRMKQ